jgi:peptide/nickel transport system permease protein
VYGRSLLILSADFVVAATAVGVGGVRMIFRHVLPHLVPLIVVYGTLGIATTVLFEATLSFLGVGVPITEPSLGLLIANGYSYMLSGLYWIAFYPGIALLAAILAINLVGDRLADIMNPRLKR